MPPAGKAVYFGSFSLRRTKENDPGCRGGTRRSFFSLFAQITFKTVGSRTDWRLAFFTGLKKVSKEMTTLAAGMTVRLDGF